MRFVCFVSILATAAACATASKRTAIGAGGDVLASAAESGAVRKSLEEQATEMQGVATVWRTANGILVNLDSSVFVSNSSVVLKPVAVEQIAELGDVLVKYPRDRIRIEGYLDSTGSEAHEEELSLRRARAVRDVLATRGVSRLRMDIEGMGAVRSVADDSTPDGSAENHRVELHIYLPDDTSSLEASR